MAGSINKQPLPVPLSLGRPKQPLVYDVSSDGNVAVTCRSSEIGSERRLSSPANANFRLVADLHRLRVATLTSRRKQLRLDVIGADKMHPG